MKRRIKTLSLIALSLILVIGMLSGCSSKPKPEDAQAYVQAVLDVICTGDYDHSVNIADIEEGKEGELRESVIDAMLASFGAEQGVNDEVKARFKESLIDAFSKAKYTVGDAVATDDGGYDVSVTIEPLQIFAGFNENFESRVQAEAMANADKVAAMSDEEVNAFVMGVLIDMINENLADPQYDPAETVTVHYGLLDEENNMYGCTSEEGEKLGAKIFSSTGMN
jgi:hypothetical protein